MFSETSSENNTNWTVTGSRVSVQQEIVPILVKCQLSELLVEYLISQQLRSSLIVKYSNELTLVWLM